MVVGRAVLCFVEKYLELLVGHRKRVDPKGWDMYLQFMIAPCGGFARILHIDAFIVGALNLDAVHPEDKIRCRDGGHAGWLCSNHRGLCDRNQLLRKCRPLSRKARLAGFAANVHSSCGNRFWSPSGAEAAARIAPYPLASNRELKKNLLAF